jgi:DNA-binding transcriptional regulator YiaG
MAKGAEATPNAPATHGSETDLMTPADFTAWRSHLGLSRAEAARRLGCGPNQPRIWEDGETPVPTYIALACAALAFDLPPWRPGP